MRLGKFSTLVKTKPNTLNIVFALQICGAWYTSLLYSHLIATGRKEESVFKYDQGEDGKIKVLNNIFSIPVETCMYTNLE